MTDQPTSDKRSYPLLWLRHRATLAGYWIRPYDSMLDDRRWRWQKRGACGRTMPPEVVSALTEAVDGLLCSTCGQRMDSPPCSLNRDIGWSGHTVAGNGGRPCAKGGFPTNGSPE